MTRTSHLLGGLALTALLATGCTSADPASSPTPSTASSTSVPSEPAAATSTASAPVDIQAVADEVRTGVPEITDVLVYDETTDPNDLLGRPNGYIAAAALTDRRATGAEGIQRGAVLEVWPTAADAKTRADYITALQKGNTLLGSEYHHLRDNVLLRVSGELPPSVNDEYMAAFG